MQRLDPIYETVRRVKAELAPSTTFLGFAGSPWTVATYMIAGQGSRDQSEARRLAYTDPDKVGAILDLIATTTVDYLSRQIEAGVDAVQLFDSWAGSLAPAQFEAFVIKPTAWIVDQLKRRHRGFNHRLPKGAGGKLGAYAVKRVDAIGCTRRRPPWAAKALPAQMPVQGNLDPLALIAGGEQMATAVTRIIDALGDRPHIFNLGHGIQQDTPIAHVEKLLAMVRGK